MVLPYYEFLSKDLKLFWQPHPTHNVRCECHATHAGCRAPVDFWDTGVSKRLGNVLAQREAGKKFVERSAGACCFTIPDPTLYIWWQRETVLPDDCDRSAARRLR